VRQGGADDLESVRGRLDPGIWEEHAAMDVEGCSILATLSPDSTESLAHTLEELSRDSNPTLLRGNGTRIAFGNLGRGANLMLTTRKLDGIRCFEPDDGVVEVSAGTTLADLRSCVSAQGWELPLDAGGPHTTVGGVVAGAATGPRCHGFGPVKKNVLGLEVVLASGAVTRCGGRVVKNVTGYDLAKLYTGSFGTLGVISGAWLRLQPVPASLAVRVAAFSEIEVALAAGLEASRRGATRACAITSAAIWERAGLASASAAEWKLLVEFAGEEAECRRDARWLEESVGAIDPGLEVDHAPGAFLDALRDTLVGGSMIRSRIACLPTRIEAAVSPLRAAGAQLTIHPGMGLIEAEFVCPSGGSTPSTLSTSSEVARALESVEHAARRSGGNFAIESMPSCEKSGIDVFGEVGPALAIMKRLKAEFDPRSLLNPGRFAGGI